MDSFGSVNLYSGQGRRGGCGAVSGRGGSCACDQLHLFVLDKVQCGAGEGWVHNGDLILTVCTVCHPEDDWNSITVERVKKEPTFVSTTCPQNTSLFLTTPPGFLFFTPLLLLVLSKGI